LISVFGAGYLNTNSCGPSVDVSFLGARKRAGLGRGISRRTWKLVDFIIYNGVHRIASIVEFEAGGLHSLKCFFLIYKLFLRSTLGFQISKILGQQKRAGARDGRGFAGGGDRRRRSSCNHRR
jgi:hypothetical protein